MELETQVDQEITRELLDYMWSNCSDSETARFLDGRMRKLEAQSRRNFIEAGIIALEVSDRCLWKDMFDPETGECFASFDDWLTNCCPVSRSSAYEAMRALKALPSLSVDTMKEIPRTNLRTLAALSSKVGRDEKVIEAAKTQSEAKFKETLRVNHPTQHIEDEEGIYFRLAKSQKSVVMQAIELSYKVDETKTKEEALESVCVDFLNNNNGWK